MTRTASVISVIGFMLFIWFEPNAHDAYLLPPKISEHADVTEADPIPEKHEKEHVDQEHPDTDSSDHMQTPVTFVDFPDDVTPTSISDTALSSAAPQPPSDPVMPETLTPLTAPISDLEEQPAQPELNPLPPLSASVSMPEPAPLAVPLIAPLAPVKSEQDNQQAMMMIEPSAPLMPASKPDKTTQETGLTTTPPVIQADMQSHHKAMQLLEQSDHMLDLELFWPSNANDYEHIARILRQCFGMTAGYLTPDHELYLVRNQSVKQANRQLYSPYSRVIQSSADSMETGHINTLKAELGPGTPLRIFTKIGDSYIIGGLMKAAGTHDLKGRIKGTYMLDQGRLYLGQISINGTAISSHIALSDQSAGRCM